MGLCHASSSQPFLRATNDSVFGHVEALRSASTCRGKKAKRKAREKQLEEARRLASLQKKRELKAAGIEMREMKRKSRGINYNNEVAFEKKPVPGFYDVGEEQQTTKLMGQEFRPVTLEEMEGKRRKVSVLGCCMGTDSNILLHLMTSLKCSFL